MKCKLVKQYFLILLASSALFISCFKISKTKDVCDYDPCAIVAPPKEVKEVKKYLADKGITDAIKHCSGMYYRITDPGTGAIPGICSQITVNYRAHYKNGTVLDEQDGATLSLRESIKGWKNGLPLIHKGGKIELFVPPTLAYGESISTPEIPANSMLIFEIELMDLK